MNKKVAIIITPNWQDYGEKYLPDLVPSLRAQDYAGEMKFFITDNESSEESFNLLKRLIPEAEVIRNKNNDGYAKGTNDSIRAAMKEKFDLIAVFNIHTVLEPGCIREMIKAMESDDRIAVVQARQMMPDKKTINSLGNATHFLGFGYCIGYRDKWEDQITKVTDIFYASGSSMLFKGEILEQVGLFDEEFWMYNEDQELPWRLRLAGYRVVLAPQAVLYNNYEFQRSIKKFYWMDRNRIISILICYKIPTLFLIFPAFVIMELGLILFSISGGWFKDKMRVWLYFLRPRTWKYICKARKRNQSLRKVKDKDIARLITGKIWYQEIDNWKLRIINPVFDLYWRIIRNLIYW